MPRRAWRLSQDLGSYGDDELYTRDETLDSRNRTDSAKAAGRMSRSGPEFFNLNEGFEESE